MPTLVSVLIGLIALVSSAWAEPEPLRVGLLAPLSGTGAEYGELIVTGARLAAREVKADLASGGLRLELQPEDDQCQGRAAISAYENLTKVRKVDLILGPLCNAATVPLLPIAERDRALLITVGLTTPDILAAGAAVFNLLPPVGVVAERIADFGFEKLGRRKVSVLYVENEFGEENRRIFTETWRRRGGEVVSQESFPMESQDFRALLTRAKFDASDVLYAVGYVPHYNALIKAMLELGVKKPLLARIKGFTGANGPVNFDVKGNNSLWHELEVRTIVRGEFAAVSKR